MHKCSHCNKYDFNGVTLANTLGVFALILAVLAAGMFVTGGLLALDSGAEAPDIVFSMIGGWSAIGSFASAILAVANASKY